jgi:GTP-binding protein
MNNNILIATVFEKGGYPHTKKAEIAVCGRSNCGKSTLINSLLGVRAIARTSSRPGKTISINFFNYDDKLVLVDLPGYGYAKISGSVKKNWKHMINDYLSSRGQLKAALLLIDVRRGLEDEEIQFIEWLKDMGIKVHIVLTKIDKLSNNELSRAKTATLAQVSNLWQDMNEKTIFVSASKKIGMDELKKKLRAYYRT